MGEKINNIRSSVIGVWRRVESVYQPSLSCVALPGPASSVKHGGSGSQNTQWVRVLRHFKTMLNRWLLPNILLEEKEKNKGIRKCHVVNESKNSSWFWSLLDYLGTLDNLNKVYHSSHSQRPAYLSHEPVTARNNHAKRNLFLYPSS